MLTDVTLGDGPDATTAKQASWAGYASTDFRVLPGRGTFQIMFRQRIPTDPSLANELFAAIYAGVRPAAGAPDAEERPADQNSADWPGWLGPGRDGRVPAFAAETDWAAEPREAWRTEVGSGYGSPLVVGNSVYQHARQGGEEVLWRLDAETGEPVWRKAWPAAFAAAPGGERHGAGPKASPLHADGRVYTQSITGEVRAWDADAGGPLWKYSAADRFPPGRPNWGAAGSPAFLPGIGPHGAVAVHLGTDDAGVLLALAAATGDVLWELAGDGPSYSSPVAAEFGGVRQVVVWTHDAVLGVDAGTGAELWRSPLPHVGGDQNMPTPTVHNGTVIVGAENRGVRALRPTRDDEGNWSVAELWRTDAAALDMSTAVICDGTLYGFSHYDSGRFFALDPAAGGVLWAGPPRAGRNATFLSVLPVGDRDGRVLALTDDGRLTVLAARGAETEALAVRRLAETEAWAPPAPIPGGLLVKDGDALRRWAFGGGGD